VGTIWPSKYRHIHAVWVMLREGDPMQKALITVLLAVLMATPADAQREDKALAPRAAPAPKLAMSQSPNPTVDEGTVQRISFALLSYTALEVRLNPAGIVF
jgi:hypothetical protein